MDSELSPVSVSSSSGSGPSPSSQIAICSSLSFHFKTSASWPSLKLLTNWSVRAWLRHNPKRFNLWNAWVKVNNYVSICEQRSICQVTNLLRAMPGIHQDGNQGLGQGHVFVAVLEKNTRSHSQSMVRYLQVTVLTHHKCSTKKCV